MKRFLVTAVVLAAFALVLTNFNTQAGNPDFAAQFAENNLKNNAQEANGTYNFDKAHTFIGFRIKHMGLIEVPGYFRDFTGTVNYDAKDVSKSSVEFSAKMTSVDTGVSRRDDHLRGADFFEVEKYPDMTFKSTKVAKNGDNWTVTGDFTMKGVTKTISFPFNVTGVIKAGPGMKMGLTAETMINRRDFGINYGENKPGMPVAVADDVKVVLQIEANKSAPKPTAE